MTAIKVSEGVVEQVQAMYDRHPFPPPQRRGTYRAHAAFVRRFLEEQGVDPAGRHFGDIACGTGLMLADYAREFPDTRFTGVDLTPASVDRANATLAEQGSANARCVEGDITALDLEGEFDYLVSWGTVHHLPDPEAGLARLCRTLKAGGVLRLGVYGYFGNWERRVRRDLIAAATRDLPAGDWDGRVDAVREWAAGDPTFDPTRTAPPVDLADPDWVVDEFLHVWEKHLRLADVVTWLERDGLEVLRLTDYYDVTVPLDVRAWTGDERFARRVRALPLAAQCDVVEMIARPYWLSVLARRR